MQNTTKPRLHHACLNISKGSLEQVVEIFQLLECPVVYEPHNGYRWAMVGQPQLEFSLQLTEVADSPIIELDKKRQLHIAFISPKPREIVEQAKSWAASKNITFREGGWSEREFYFDLPDLFVNFVIEVMHSSIEEEN